MTSVLVVDDDEEMRSALGRDLAHHGYDVRTASSVAEARARIAESAPDILLTDLRMAEEDGIDLLKSIRQLGASTRPILMSAYATARDHQVAIELGAVRVLSKPFSPMELLQAIRQAEDCETGFRGNVHGLSLLDLLQMFHYSRRSITISLGSPTEGSIHVRDGEVVHAVHGAHEGEPALRALLATPSGAISTSPLATETRSIGRDFRSLVLDLLRQLDETTRDDPDPDLDEWNLKSEFPPEPTTLSGGWLARLSRISPTACVYELNPTDPLVRVLAGHEIPAVEFRAAVVALARQNDALARDWQVFEAVVGRFGLAIVRVPRTDRVLVVLDVLLGRFSAVRFRAHVGRVAAAVN